MSEAVLFAHFDLQCRRASRRSRGLSLVQAHHRGRTPSRKSNNKTRASSTSTANKLLCGVTTMILRRVTSFSPQVMEAGKTSNWERFTTLKMMGDLEVILGSITITNVLTTVIVVLLVYYLWPWFQDPLKDIPGPPVYPLWGSLLAVDHKKGIGPSEIEIAKKYGKIFKLYEGRTPTVVIGDVHKLRKAMIKEFNNFTFRRPLPFRGVFKHSLFDAGGDEWRRQRHLMTPSFTTGKLKRMQTMIQKCVDRCCDNIGKMADSGEDIDTKTYTGMYTMDVIASTAFGVDLDSQADPNNPFLVNAKMIFDINPRSIGVLATLFAPFLIPLLELFQVRTLPDAPTKFFARMMETMIKERKQNPNAFMDVLQLMVSSQDLAMDDETRADLREQGQTTLDASRVKKGLSDEEILADALLFFMAGYDTTANTLSFLIYQLSLNPAIQQQLYDAVTTHMAGKSVSYETVWNIPYLDQCINETLRIYPPAQRMDRESAEDIDIEGLHIPAGTLIVAPIYALHHDPEVWPEPDKFDPSRFTPEARAARDPLHFIPFGLGPRQCIGMRLALFEMKMLMVQLIQRYKFLPSEKPLVMDFGVLVKAKTGAWVKAERR